MSTSRSGAITGPVPACPTSFKTDLVVDVVDTCFSVRDVESDLEEANLFCKPLCAEFAFQLEVDTITEGDEGEVFCSRDWEAFGVM